MTSKSILMIIRHHFDSSERSFYWRKCALDVFRPYWFRMCIIQIWCLLLGCTAISIADYHKPNERNTRKSKWKSAHFAEKDCNKKNETTSVALSHRNSGNLTIRRRHQYKSVHLFLRELYSLIWSISFEKN